MIYISDKDFEIDKTAVTLGKFDGIHLGHRLLLDHILGLEGLSSVLFTFDLHPGNLFNGNDFKVLYTNEEKCRLLEKSGLDYLIAYPFTSETRNMSPEEFVKEVLCDKLHAKYIVVGTDFGFGKNRAGNVEFLKSVSKKYNFELIVYDKLVVDGEEVGSTRIRKLISEGEVREAGKLLGHPFFIYGEVVHGNNMGHTIGMPTANIIVPGQKLVPPYGVYASITEIDGVSYNGITNIGVKPSVGNNNALGAETFLFDFDEDIYGKRIEVKLVEMIRTEKKFDSLAKVKEQVDIDCIRAKDILKRE